MTASGCLMHLVLHPRPASSVPKEKISDDSPIELEVEQVAQWPLQRPPAAADLLAPLPPSNPLLQPLECRRCSDMCMSEEERWLAQVEIVTHAGPHRRLWMGPQFVFKTYNCTGSNSSLSEAETVDVETVGIARSNPVNMPGVRPIVPVLIDSGSASSLEQSPSDSFRRKSLLAETGRAAPVCDVQLREDLAEAMKEDHGSRRAETAVGGTARHGVELAVDPAGTVVRALPVSAPPAPDPDDYTRANSDEATFRPVVRAPASLPQELPVCPLPRTTTIPVQSLATEVAGTEPATLDYLAADARLQQEMDEARRELPSRYPTRLSDDSVKVSSDSVNMSSVSVEIDRSRAAEEPSDTLVREEETEVATAFVVEVPALDVVQIEKNNSELETMKRDAYIGVPKTDISTKKNSSVEISSKPLQPETSIKLKCDDIKPETSIKLKCDDIKVAKDKKDAKTAKVKGTSDSKKTKQEVVQLKKENTFKAEAVEVKKNLAETSKDLKSGKETTSKIGKESKSETKIQCRKEVSETITPAKETKFETKSNKKESHDTKMSTKEVTSEIKTSTAKESSELKVSQNECLSEKKISAKEFSDSKMSINKDSFATSLTIQKEFPESHSEYPKLRTYSKEGSTDRESSPRKEPKSFSAWRKDSPKLDWSIKSEPLEPMLSSQKEIGISKTLRLEEVQIKTEEQAWDMLLNEPDKQVLSISPLSTASDKNDESKSKSKKNRKIKKSQDDTQNKSEDDSFVEIHAIEEKVQSSSGELVSISLPFEEIESACSFSSKSKKSRSPKNTLEKEQSQSKLDDWSLEDIDCTNKFMNSNKQRSIVSDIEIAPEFNSKLTSEESKMDKLESIKVDSFDTANIESIIFKEISRDKKPKSLVSNQENRKPVQKSLEVDVKDVYVIDSTKDEFPEIQITSSRGSKMRKKSPQVDSDKRNEDNEVIPEKPIKSWSSITASKNSKKSVDIDKQLEKAVANKADDNESDYRALKIEKKKTIKYQEDEEPLSLHEELMRLCKRTDILVAQCDAPSGLNFVEEHHSLLHDLPPLELDFGLDDFRLEVMRDSLLDANDTKLSSPICKIDIDSILSSIKESTSAFNLIDLEKVPDKKEKGFSVVENDKYTSHEVKADDESKSEDKDIEVMEKSSDDDNASPTFSTDSDKEDKKSTGASNVTLPSSKQSSKSKKSRRKKK